MCLLVTRILGTVEHIELYHYLSFFYASLNVFIIAESSIDNVHI